MTRKIVSSFVRPRITGRLVAPLALTLLSLAPACKSSGSGPGGAAAALDGSNAAVVDWSTIAYDSYVAADKYAEPLRVVRVLAMLHLAQHDALAAIRPTYGAHALHEKAPDADPVAAASSAAFEVLVAELPGQKGALAARLEQSLQQLGDPVARDKGIALGQRAAAAILKERQGDGSAVPTRATFTPEQMESAGPGRYRPVAPFDFLLAPGWRTLRPFGLQTPQQFRVQPPPALDSADYTASFEEVKRLGKKGSTDRSPEQTAYAKFWYEFSDVGWNRIGRTVAADRKLGLQASARLFALLNMALSDAYVAGWDSKYHHDFWRPTTAIQAAASDGNPATAPDPSWESELVTPPVQDYPSTHSALGNAGAEVLAHVFGDATAFSFPSTSAAPGSGPRSFTSFSQAADENADSRVQAGLHFGFACRAGQALGKQVGAWVAATQLRPQP